MAKHLRVSVNWKHIKTAKPGSSQQCSIAMAIRDAIERAGIEVQMVSVGLDAFIWRGMMPDGSRCGGEFPLSKRATSWRSKFDRGVKVIPTRFSIQVA